MKMKIRKRVELGILFGLICAIMLSFSRFEMRCDDLRQNVLRLHIVANSDSEADQKLKLAVRDKILESSIDVFKNCNTVAEASKTARIQLDEFCKIANDVIRQNGFEYTATAKIDTKYFGTREYQDFTLPAGNYSSLVIDLGKGNGQNWWCVVFPCVCVPTAYNAQLSDSVSDDAAEVAQNAPQYEIKFKSVEIYEEIRKIFSKK